MKKLLITGSTGLLGTWLMEGNRLSSFVVLGYNSKTMDITSEKMVDNIITEVKPDIVLHLAAYTDVFRAEEERLKCFRINVTGTQNVVESSKKVGAKVVYISTEYVFDGEQGNYFEKDIPFPLNYYGLTKLEGEKEVQKYNNSVIIRTLFKPYPFKHKVVPTDMWTTGGYIQDIGRELIVALQLIDKLPSILHIGLERKNLFDLAKESRDDLQSVTREDLKVKLPEDASLNSSLWERIKYDSRIKTHS